MALAVLKKSITPNGLGQEELVTFLANAVLAVNELQTALTAVKADLATVRTALNTAMTKLNADAGVTDTNYAAAGVITSTDLVQLTLKLTP